MSGPATLVARLCARPAHLSVGSLAAGLALACAPPAAGVGVAAAAAAVAAVARAPPAGLIPVVAVLAGVAGGHERLNAIDRPSGGLHDGDRVQARAVLAQRPRPGAFGSGAEVVLRSGRARGARVLARAGFGMRWPRGGEPGTELVLGGLARRARRDHSGFDAPAWLRRRGIAFELELERIRATGRRRGGVPGAVDATRRRAERAIGAAFDPRSAALMRGMVLGEDESIARPVRDDWRAAGLGHLLAVSGQNVMLLGVLALPVLAALGLGTAGRAVALLGLIALYVPLAGAGPSLQRAGVMGAAGIVATLASRPASRVHALLLAAAATLALNPRVVGDPGWQLSFAAVAGILALVPGLRRRLLALWRLSRPNAPARPGRLAVGLIEGLSVTVGATLATAPLLVHHFGSVPLATLPANLAALPAVAPVMWTGMVMTALGQMGAPGLALAKSLGTVAAPAVSYLGIVAERFAAAPGAKLGMLRSSSGVLFAYLLLGASALALRCAEKRVEPRLLEALARWRRTPRGGRRAALAVSLAAGALLASAAFATPKPPDLLTVSFLDVGQGDATLIQHPDGSAVLFDGGPPEGHIWRCLRKAGVRRLSAVVATHASRDHHGGLAEVLRRYPVGMLLDGGDGTRDPGFRALEREADGRGIRRVPAVAPMVLRAGGLRIDVISPPSRPPGPPPEDPNQRAVVAVVSSGAFDLFLSADAESETLAPLTLPDVDAMKVPHHGSADPGLPDILKRLRPEMAGIEVGAHNTYGHPAPSTLRALRAARIPAYRTDANGTIKLTWREGKVSVRTDHQPLGTGH